MSVSFDQQTLAGILPRCRERRVNLYIDIEVRVAYLLLHLHRIESRSKCVVITPSRHRDEQVAVAHRRTSPRRRNYRPQAGVETGAIEIVSDWRLRNCSRSEAACHDECQQ